MSKPILPTINPPSTVPLPAGKNPRDVSIKAGLTLVLHDGAKVLLRVTATKDTRYFTAWLAIVGTASEVDAKVASLGLA